MKGGTRSGRAIRRQPGTSARNSAVRRWRSPRSRHCRSCRDIVRSRSLRLAPVHECIFIGVCGTGQPLSSACSMLFAGVEPVDTLRARGAFAAFRAARVSGEKGKLSFTPTEGLW